MTEHLDTASRSKFATFLDWLHRNYGVYVASSLTIGDDGLLYLSDDAADWMVSKGFAFDAGSEDGRRLLNISTDLYNGAIDQEEYERSVSTYDGFMIGRPTGLPELDHIISGMDDLEPNGVVYLRCVYNMINELDDAAINTEFIPLIKDETPHRDIVQQLAHALIEKKRDGI